MALTHEEITAIKKEVINECKNIFVQIDDCNTTQAEVNKKFANDDKRIDRIVYLQEDTNNKLTKNNWLTIAVLGCIIVGVVTFLYSNFGG